MILYQFMIKNYGFDRIVKPSGEIDKKIIYDTLMSSVIKKAYMMLDYENVPEEIPKRMLKTYLITNGHFAGFVNKGKMMISWGTFGGIFDEYYFPTQYLINNPYIDMDKKTLDIGKDCIIVKNDSLAEPLMNVISKHVNMLVENETTMVICDILARARGILSAKDDQMHESAQQYLKQLFQGRVVPVKSDNFTGDNFETVSFGTESNILTDLIEYEQYIRSSLYSELGIRLNFNMKREALNSEETSMDKELLKPYIDNLIETQNEDLLMLSDFWGLPEPIRCKRGSIWEEQEQKDEIIMETMEAQVEALEAQAEAQAEAAAEPEETTPEEDDGKEETENEEVKEDAEET